MKTLINSLKQFNLFVNGGQAKAFRKVLKAYNSNLDNLNSDFHETTINNPLVREHIKLILRNLSISQKKSNKYFNDNLSVYNFLVMLNRDGYLQANYFLEKVNKKTRISKLQLFIGGVVTSGTLLSILSNPAFSDALSFIIGFLQSPIGVPLLGGLFSLSMAVYNIYTTVTDEKHTDFTRTRDLIFNILKSLVTLTAYGLVIASSILMTPLVASLFIGGLYVLAAVINVGKELFALVQELVQKDPIDGETLLDHQRSYIRHEIAYKTHRNAAIINLTTAVALIGTTLISSFVPGGAVVILGVLAALTLIYGAQYFLLKYNNKIMRSELQNELNKVNELHSETREMEMTNVLSIKAPGPVLPCEQQVPDLPSDAIKTAPVSGLFSARGLGFFNNAAVPAVQEEQLKHQLQSAEEQPSAPAINSFT